MNKKEEASELARLRRLYKEKNEYLSTYFEEVVQVDFYRDIFPIGSFERRGCYSDAKPNGLALDIKGKGTAFHHTITDGLDELKDLEGRDFVIMSPIGYFGGRRSADNARYFFAFTFDLDDVGMINLQNVIHQMNNEILPKATYIVNSGTGLHLYYLLREPLPLYPHVQKKLKEMKFSLIDKIWNKYTSSNKDPQRQGIMQGFRIVGSSSKLGAKFPVTAFQLGDKVTLEYFNSFVPAAKQIADINYKSKLTLDEAKAKYPEWYDKRIVRGERRGRWMIKRDLYDWWKHRLLTEIVVGKRFYGIFTLAIYAKKCGILEDELRADAYEIMEHFDALSVDKHNRFTNVDVEAALGVFNENYVTFPRDDIVKLTGLPMNVNKRNGRKQADHVKLMNAMKSFKKQMGEEMKEGRPSARQHVAEYLEKHPDARKCDVIRGTGLDKKTVYKYYGELTHRE